MVPQPHPVPKAIYSHIISSNNHAIHGESAAVSSGKWAGGLAHANAEMVKLSRKRSLPYFQMSRISKLPGAWAAHVKKTRNAMRSRTVTTLTGEKLYLLGVLKGEKLTDQTLKKLIKNCEEKLADRSKYEASRVCSKSFAEENLDKCLSKLGVSLSALTKEFVLSSYRKSVACGTPKTHKKKTKKRM